jgi:hypothetical protein
VDAWWPACVWWWAFLPYHVRIENGETIKIVKRCIQLDNHITCHKLPNSTLLHDLVYLHSRCRSFQSMLPPPRLPCTSNAKTISHVTCYEIKLKISHISKCQNMHKYLGCTILDDILALFFKVLFFPFVIRKPSNIYIYIYSILRCSQIGNHHPHEDLVKFSFTPKMKV